MIWATALLTLRMVLPLAAQQSSPDSTPAAPRADDPREEEGHAVERHLVQEVDEDGQQHLGMQEGAPYAFVADHAEGVAFVLQIARHPLPLVGRQPGRLVRPVGQPEPPTAPPNAS